MRKKAGDYPYLEMSCLREMGAYSQLVVSVLKGVPPTSACVVEEAVMPGEATHPSCPGRAEGFLDLAQTA